MLLVFIGQTPIALLITLLFAIVILGTRGRSLAELDDPRRIARPICAIILITGAGGMFGGVFGSNGVGEALSSSLSDLGLSPIILGLHHRGPCCSGPQGPPPWR